MVFNQQVDEDETSGVESPPAGEEQAGSAVHQVTKNCDRDAEIKSLNVFKLFRLLPLRRQKMAMLLLAQLQATAMQQRYRVRVRMIHRSTRKTGLLQEETPSRWYVVCSQTVEVAPLEQD